MGHMIDQYQTHKIRTTLPQQSSFELLRNLLKDVFPTKTFKPIALHLGEVATCCADNELFSGLTHTADWARYPPLGGTEELKTAYKNWISRSFHCSLDETSYAIEPTAGSKQAISVLIKLAVDQSALSASGRSFVVMSNPFYPTYYSAVHYSSAEPIFYDADAENLVDAIMQVVKKSDKVAALILCNPGQPNGRIISIDVLCAIHKLALEFGFQLIIDECYIDFAPTYSAGYANTVRDNTDALQNVVLLHSLSKRSSAPGLRSGFLFGDRDLVAAYASYNRNCGVSLSYNVCSVAASLWKDDKHIAQQRARIAYNWSIADAILGDIPGYKRVLAGLFLWLPVEDDQKVARELWERTAVKTMPGSYLGAEDCTGHNPGKNHLRISLSAQSTQVETALQRMKSVLVS